MAAHLDKSTPEEVPDASPSVPSAPHKLESSSTHIAAPPPSQPPSRQSNPAPSETWVSRLLTMAKNHWTLGSVILICIFIINLGNLTKAVASIHEFITSLSHKPVRSVPKLFEILEGLDHAQADRIEALRVLIDDYGWTDFHGRTLARMNFPPRNWKGIELTEANLREVRLNGASMREVSLIRAQLHSADLRGADLQGARLNGASARHAYFDGAILSEAMLRGGDYQEARFCNCKLSQAWMQACDFTRADFTDADLYSASFSEGPSSVWKRCDLTEAIFVRTRLRGTDLRNTHGIETACFTGAIYDRETRFPDGFDAVRAGMEYDPTVDASEPFISPAHGDQR